MLDHFHVVFSREGVDREEEVVVVVVGGKFYIILEIITKQSDSVSGKVVNNLRDGALFPTIIKSRFAFYASVSFPPVSGCPLAPWSWLNVGGGEDGVTPLFLFSIENLRVAGRFPNLPFPAWEMFVARLVWSLENWRLASFSVCLNFLHQQHSTFRSVKKVCLNAACRQFLPPQVGKRLNPKINHVWCSWFRSRVSSSLRFIPWWTNTVNDCLIKSRINSGDTCFFTCWLLSPHITALAFDHDF